MLFIRHQKIDNAFHLRWRFTLKIDMTLEFNKYLKILKILPIFIFCHKKKFQTLIVPYILNNTNINIHLCLYMEKLSWKYDDLISHSPP